MAWVRVTTHNCAVLHDPRRHGPPSPRNTPPPCGLDHARRCWSRHWPLISQTLFSWWCSFFVSFFPPVLPWLFSFSLLHCQHFLRHACTFFTVSHTHTHIQIFAWSLRCFFLSSQRRKLLLILLFPGLLHPGSFSHLWDVSSRIALLFSYEYLAILEQVSQFLSPISSSRSSPGSSSHKANIFLFEYEF